MLRRVLIDLTDLQMWTGHHGGTQRVVYGIAKNFYLKAETLAYKVEFIAFSSSKNEFYFTSFEPIYKRVEASRHSNQSTLKEDTALSRVAIIRIKLRPFVPEKLRKNIFVRKVAQKVLNRTRLYKHKLDHLALGIKKRDLTVHASPVSFTSGDLVLVLGKPWDNLDIQRTLCREKADSGFKLVQLVYDLIICLHPQLHHPSLFRSYTENMFEAVAVSDLIISISDSTAKDLNLFCRELKLPLPRIKTIRLGDEISMDDKEPIVGRPSPLISDQFIACVGTIEIRKNHSLLYYVYKLAQEKNINLPQLVIVGGRGWLSGDFQYLVEHDPDVKKKIIILDNLNDASLSWIYQNCMFTIYPSMYEGWGLPVAESLAYGKPCVASNSSSIPEIAGQLVTYFSPYDPAECLQEIMRMMDSALRTKLTRKIVKEYKVTPWTTTYKQVEDAIQSIGSDD